jgi:RND family efflux transporter MFP subunit
MSEPEEIEESLEEMESTRRKAIHAVMSFLLGVVILIILAAVVVFLVKTKSKADRVVAKPLVPVVDVWEVSTKPWQATIVSQGVVESIREVTLSAEVAGRVVLVAPQLLRGAAVGEGDVLVEIEQADYLAEQARAEAALAEAKLVYAQEEARKEQALRDWQKLGRGKPSDLMLRIPQLASAEARVDSATAEVARAARNVERTRITAPFDGTVRMESVELGAILVPGSMVAQMYSTRELEVRLPLALSDFGFLQRNDDGSVEGEVVLTGTIGTRRCEWPGQVVRVDGEVDRETLSATIIVRVGEAADEPPYLRYPPVGLFVEAIVPGRELKSLAKIPRDALRGGSEVIVVDENNLLSIREVRIARSDRTHVYVSEGVENGEPVVTTRMSGVANGVEVEINKRRGENVVEAVEEQP